MIDGQLCWDRAVKLVIRQADGTLQWGAG